MAEYIDRQAAIDAIRKDMYADKDYMSALICDGIADVLNKLPSADVQQVRRGHWEKIGDKTWWGLYECSECHLICSIDYDYCPHCGAKNGW